MDASERERSRRIEWDPRDLRLNDLTIFTSLLLDLYSNVAVPYVLTEDQSGSNVAPPESPRVISIRMGSSLVIELLSEPSGIAIAALGVFEIILKHPDRLGEFLPKVREYWYRGNIEADEQKQLLKDMRIKFDHVKSRAPVIITEGPAVERSDTTEGPTEHVSIYEPIPTSQSGPSIARLPNHGGPKPSEPSPEPPSPEPPSPEPPNHDEPKRGGPGDGPSIER